MPRPIPKASPAAPFVIPAGVYFRCALAQPGVGRTALWLLAAAVVAGLAISVAAGDVRIALVAMMILFVALPMVMALVYFSIALSPEATRATLPHTAALSPEAITLSYIQSADTDSPAPAPPDETIAASEVERWRAGRRHIVIRIRGGRLVIIPLDAVNLDPSEHCLFGEFD